MESLRPVVWCEHLDGFRGGFRLWFRSGSKGLVQGPLKDSVSNRIFLVDNKKTARMHLYIVFRQFDQSTLILAMGFEIQHTAPEQPTRLEVQASQAGGKSRASRSAQDLRKARAFRRPRQHFLASQASCESKCCLTSTWPNAKTRELSSFLLSF